MTTVKRGGSSSIIDDDEVIEVVDRAASGQAPTLEELARLYYVDPISEAGKYARKTAHEMSLHINNGYAEIHAQIGMDGSACHKNCQFCSFAASNGLRPAKLEMSKEDVLEYARIYEQLGVNLLCLMVTASYNFNKYLDIAQSVRDIIDPRLPLMANIDDISYEQALQLKEVGFNAIYHVIHMGEGVITGIDPQLRRASIRNAKKAGLTVGSCVEPIGIEHTGLEVAERMLEVNGFGLVSSGAGFRIPVPGSAFENDPRIAPERWGLVNALMRFVAGDSIKLLGAFAAAGDSGGNVGWVEMGTNPRDVTERTEDGGMGENATASRKVFESFGWKILEGPSQGWMLG